MTHPPPHQSPDDVAIAAALERLLEERGESVVDVAHFTRISVSSLYRKLAGQQSWKASDVGAIARHYGIDPGRLFARPDDPTTPPPADHLLSPFSGRLV